MKIILLQFLDASPNLANVVGLLASIFFKSMHEMVEHI